MMLLRRSVYQFFRDVNMAFLNRLQGALLAFLLMTLLMALFVGRIESSANSQALHHIDFWLVWLCCMVLLTLPMLLLESALAKRTQMLPLQALPKLTREADASTRWRSVGWLALGSVLLLAGFLSAESSVYLVNLLDAGDRSNVVAVFMPYVVIVIVAGLSYALRWLPLLGTVLIVALMAMVMAMLIATLTGLDGLHPTISSWQSTHFTWTEWVIAVELALVASGVGLGIYWQVRLAHPTKAPLKIWPIWIAQLLGGAAVALGWVSFAHHQHPTILLIQSLALLSGAAILFAFARQQLISRGMPTSLTWLVLVASLAVWALPITSSLLSLTVLLSILVSVMYAILGGWKMKSSHLRKALELNHEGLYNLWRVMIRLVIPLAGIIAMVSIVVEHVMGLR
jgi:hypothetical protein